MTVNGSTKFGDLSLPSKITVVILSTVAGFVTVMLMAIIFGLLHHAVLWAWS